MFDAIKEETIIIFTSFMAILYCIIFYRVNLNHDPSFFHDHICERRTRSRFSSGYNFVTTNAAAILLYHYQ